MGPRSAIQVGVLKRSEIGGWFVAYKTRCADKNQHNREKKQPYGDFPVQQRDQQMDEHGQPGEHQQPVVRRSQQGRQIDGAAPHHQIDRLSAEARGRSHPGRPPIQRAGP